MGTKLHQVHNHTVVHRKLETGQKTQILLFVMKEADFFHLGCRSVLDPSLVRGLGPGPKRDSDGWGTKELGTKKRL